MSFHTPHRDNAANLYLRICHRGKDVKTNVVFSAAGVYIEISCWAILLSGLLVR